MVSAILHGSLTLGDFAPGRSDIDLLVELSVARAHGRSLVGRPPDSVIGLVPGEWLVEIGDRQPPPADGRWHAIPR
jgi:Nucleotidyltransferase domain